MGSNGGAWRDRRDNAAEWTPPTPSFDPTPTPTPVENPWTPVWLGLAWIASLAVAYGVGLYEGWAWVGMRWSP